MVLFATPNVFAMTLTLSPLERISLALILNIDLAIIYILILYGGSIYIVNSCNLIYNPFVGYMRGSVRLHARLKMGCFIKTKVEFGYIGET